MYAGDIYDLKVLLNHCNCNVEVRSIQPWEHLARVKDLIMPNIKMNDDVISVNAFVKKEEPRQIPAAKIKVSESVV